MIFNLHKKYNNNMTIFHIKLDEKFDAFIGKFQKEKKINLRDIRELKSSILMDYNEENSYIEPSIANGYREIEFDED